MSSVWRVLGPEYRARVGSNLVLRSRELDAFRRWRRARRSGASGRSGPRPGGPLPVEVAVR